MAWINSQLKKKPGARLVEDLRNDTRDGVTFIDLISVIGKKVTHIYFEILTQTDCSNYVLYLHNIIAVIGLR